MFLTLLLINILQGGIKAVVWTDSIQAVVMVSGLIAVCIVGVNHVGGFEEIYTSLEAGGRLTAFE